MLLLYSISESLSPVLEHPTLDYSRSSAIVSCHIEREASARAVELLYIRDNLLNKGDIHKGLTTVEANVYILVM